MKTLRLDEVEFQGIVVPEATQLTFEKLKPFSYKFQFGKSYLLNGKEGEGGWALSWIVGRILDPQSGVISLDNAPYLRKQRAKGTWCFRQSEIRLLGIRKRSVKVQILHGLRTTANLPIQSEEEIIKRFLLAPERYDRPLKQLSGEAWRASCAIGFVHGRTIFCFPHVLHEIIETYQQLWLKNVLDLLKDSGALVLFPAELTPDLTNLCDEVVSLN